MNCETAMKELFARFSKSTKRTVGLCSPVSRLTETVVFSSRYLEHLLVVLDQVAAGKRGDAASDFRHLVVAQERVDLAQRLFELGQQHHLAEILAEALLRLLLLLQTKDCPAQLFQLGEQRLFDVLFLVKPQRVVRLVVGENHGLRGGLSFQQRFDRHLAG